MFSKGSTAVLSAPNLPFIVSVKEKGIYSFKDGEWSLQYRLSQNIYKFASLGHYIFGIGDNGTIVRYDSHRKKWTHTTFPTTQRLWDISGNDTGLIVTHGGSKLCVSSNFGTSWTLVKPFEELGARPLIRSLLYDKGNIYIGTQVSKDYGGLWKYSLKSGELTYLKKEEQSMISSIYIHHDDCLFITKGNVQTWEGSIEMKDSSLTDWRGFRQPISEKVFLDLFFAGKRLYATSCMDEFGYSRIYEVDKELMTLVPIETVKGHGFRGAGFAEQLFVSSSVESKWILDRFEMPGLIH